MIPTLLVLAAGMGSRYGGLKQIEPVGPSGETIIDYSVYDAMRAGFGKLVFVIRKDIETDFREVIGKRFEKKIETQYAFQEINKVPSSFKVPAERKKPWGTGHAILVAADTIKEPFAVINGDDFYGKQSFQLIADALSSAQPAQYAMVGFILRNTLTEFGTVSRGVCKLDAGSLLKNIVELRKIKKEAQGASVQEEDKILKLSGEEIVSMNLWGFHPSIFTFLQEKFARFLNEQGQKDGSEFFLPTAVSELIADKKASVKVLSTQEPWMGITYREDRPQVVQKIQQLVDAGVYRKKL